MIEEKSKLHNNPVNNIEYRNKQISKLIKHSSMKITIPKDEFFQRLTENKSNSPIKKSSIIGSLKHKSINFFSIELKNRKSTIKSPENKLGSNIDLL